MRKEHFVATPPDSNAWGTWTLPTRLGRMLSEAESKFGPRDMSWTLLGIDFGGKPPDNRYPYHPTEKHIVIRLSHEAIEDEHLAYYQLAHECIHLLAPTGGRDAPVLEEGLATAFAEDWIKNNYNLPPYPAGSYANATQLVRDFILTQQNAIPRLRAVEPTFAKMTHATFASANLQLDSAIIDQLLMRFA